MLKVLIYFCNFCRKKFDKKIIGGYDDIGIFIF